MIHNLRERLEALHVSPEHVAFRDVTALQLHLATLKGVTSRQIGRSRENRPLFGMQFGTGEFHVSIVAGSHADEPTGPMTAQALPLLLQEYFPELLEAFTFFVIPQINPDGAERNRPWFSAQLDFDNYIRLAVREQPGDDIEFGFGDALTARPECTAAMDFLRLAAPVRVHASLHGMGYSEGAWFLICKEWAGRSRDMQQLLAQVCQHEKFPLHDIQRHGEKGFTRIAPGFCTTPTSVAMRAHFESLGDPETACKFLPSSMEFAQTLGDDVLCLVSEMPLFRIQGESAQEDSLYQRFRQELAEAREASILDDFLAAHQVTAVPFALQMKMQLALLVAGIAQAQGLLRQ